jgi:hypothetical protein
MARIVLGIGTSHSTVLSLPGQLWPTYAERDRGREELVFPPEGIRMSFDEALRSQVPQAIQDRVGDARTFDDQSDRCQRALDRLAGLLAAAAPDITVIISDDQDEWFYDSNMPAFAVYWGDSAPLYPVELPADSSEVNRQAWLGYGDVRLDVPVASGLARHLIETLMDSFDLAQMNYVEPEYGGQVSRRYPSASGEWTYTLKTDAHQQGLPHGFSFVVKRLFANKPTAIVPVIQNTCYPPNNVRPARCYDFGLAIARAIKAWPEDARVAVVGSGGLSHWIVDEEIDAQLLRALQDSDAEALRSLPRNRLYSGTSESLNWVTLGGVMAYAGLRPWLVDYVPVYRTEGGTGGGLAFMAWGEDQPSDAE